MLLNKLRRLFESEAPQIHRKPSTRRYSSAISPAHPTPPSISHHLSNHARRAIPVAQAKPVVQSNELTTADTQEEAQQYLARVQEKIGKLAEEFASGMINREQFQELYDHYQREIRTIETWMDMAPQSDAWRDASSEGKSIVIRKQYMARILGYAVYKNDSGMPIATIGKFEVDAALYVPMLSSYRSAAWEIFGAGMRSLQIENGRWLCFVPGESTTLMALFSTEPASKQLKSLDQMHRLFERANRHLLSNPVIDPNTLVLPHQSFVGHKR